MKSLLCAFSESLKVEECSFSPFWVSNDLLLLKIRYHAQTYLNEIQDHDLIAVRGAKDGELYDPKLLDGEIFLKR